MLYCRPNPRTGQGAYIFKPTVDHPPGATFLGRRSQSRFLNHYGFRPAKAYYINVDGNYYDSKAIAGVAVGKQHPNLGTLTWDKFSGGDDTVKVKLEELGFVVEKRTKIPL